MARVLRGFTAQGVVACYTEPNLDGDPNDWNAPRNAPARDPLSYLGLVAFHSSFFLYELAMPMQIVQIAHPVVATATTTWNIMLGSQAILGFSIQGRPQEAEHLLINHSLGYAPLALVSYEDVMVVSGTLVQTEPAGARFVSVWANETHVGLGETAYCNEVDLPAVARVYKVLVFRVPAASAALPLFSGGSANFQIGRGMVNSESSYLRRYAAGAPFAMDLQKTIDIQNGGARIGTGGSLKSDQFYNGGFAAPPFIGVGP